MQEQPRTTAYEVLCHRCNVTFPVGSKRCIHCGGRLGRSYGMARPSLGRSVPLEEAEALEDEEAPKRSSFLPAALLWALLFAGMSIYRACASG